MPHLAVHNGLNGDIITQEVPWNSLDWLAVHHGQLPLWNHYSGDGMPLLLNFESSPLALRALVGYLFPLGASYLVGVAVTLLVAGTGTFVATRLAGVGPLGAALAGTTFMLSGSLAVGRVGPSAGRRPGRVGCWRAPFFAVSPGRGAGPGRSSSVSSGFAVYEGFPESLVFLGIATGTIVLLGGSLGALRGDARPGRAGLPRRRSRRRGGVVGPVVATWYAVLAQSSRAPRTVPVACPSTPWPCSSHRATTGSRPPAPVGSGPPITTRRPPI